MQLTQVMARAIHDPSFRSRFLTHPKVVLDEMKIPIPPTQNVTVIESQEGEIFFVLPILTDPEVERLEASLQTVHPQRSVRSQILLKARQDPAYKAQLMQEPKAVLIAAGLSIPASAKVTLLENSPEQFYIVLPHIH
jgi:hypothetical protein